MKLSKILGVAAVAALALLAFANTVSATTLETNGVKQSGGVGLDATLSGSATLESVSGTFANTCSTSTVKGTTSVVSGPTVSGPIEDAVVGGNTVVSGLTFANCTHGPVEVKKGGSLSIERIGTTTNGTVRSIEAEVKVPVTVLGIVVSATCTTAAGSGTDLGTLNGTAAGATSITINAILSCSGMLPSARWTATYVITGHSIGVVA